MSEATDHSLTDGSLVGIPERLHPLSIPYRIAQQGFGILLAVVFAGGPGFSALAGWIGAAAALALALLVAAAIVGFVIAYYRRFEYELTADTFDIRSGVLSRREREIPLRRIQNVDISQTVVQRVLGIAELRMETAGGSDSEAQLRYVGHDRATRLQAEISRLSRTGDSDTESAVEFEPVFSIADRELGVLALVSIDFRIASLLFLGASVFGPSAATVIDTQLLFGPETAIQLLLGPIAGLFSVAILGLLSGAFNAARYYDFTLRRGGEELRYERGLLQRYSGTIPIEKVQSLTIEENVLARKLGYASLAIETAGQGGTSDGQQGTIQSAVPLAERDRVLELAGSIEPLDGLDFERPPKRARERYAIRYAIVPLVLAGVLYGTQRVADVGLYWWVPLLAVLLAPIAAHLTWKHRGFYVGKRHVVTRNGFWTRKVKIVPYHRIQTVFSTETVFQRRRHLGSVTIDTAGSQSLGGNDAKAVDVASETVAAIRETVPDNLYRALGERRRAGREHPSAASDTPGD